jgi:hypothetical protein
VTYGFGFKTVEDVNQFPHIGVAADTTELKKLLLGEQFERGVSR